MSGYRPMRCDSREQTALELARLAAQVRSGYVRAFGATMLESGIGRIEKTILEGTVDPAADFVEDPTPTQRPPRKR